MTLVEAILGPIWPYVAGAAGVILGALGLWWKGRADKAAGRAEQRADDARKAAERVEKGRQAVAAGRDAGTPDQRLRDNDGRWR
jgi:hypothetical protein